MHVKLSEFNMVSEPLSLTIKRSLDSTYTIIIQTKKWLVLSDSIMLVCEINGLKGYYFEGWYLDYVEINGS